MADIAVLGSLDNQTFDDEAEAFEQFCEETEPVPLCRDEHELFKCQNTRFGSTCVLPPGTATPSASWSALSEPLSERGS